MLTQEEILSRARSLACCALARMHAAVLAWDRGDTKCGNENFEMAKWLGLYAAPVMNDAAGDDYCGPASLPDEIAAYADCICSPCECETEETDCELTPVYTVLEAIDFADLPLSPTTDDAYFILSGTNAGQIATWDGSEWQYEQVGVFELVWATVTNDYWSVGTGGGTNTGAWFPAPQMLNVIPDWWLASIQTPWMAQGRDLQLQLLGPNGWYNAAVQTNEDDLS